MSASKAKRNFQKCHINLQRLRPPHSKKIITGMGAMQEESWITYTPAVSFVRSATVQPHRRLPGCLLALSIGKEFKIKSDARPPLKRLSLSRGELQIFPCTTRPSGFSQPLAESPPVWRPCSRFAGQVGKNTTASTLCWSLTSKTDLYISLIKYIKPTYLNMI